MLEDLKRPERRPIIDAARAHGISVVAVWFTTPLPACISRNALRPADEVVSEQAIRNVHAALEPPHENEGFEQILLVDNLQVGI